MISLIKKMIPVPLLPTLLINYVGRLIKKAAYGQGMGRHSEEEIREIGYGDLKALSDFLGESWT